MAMSDEVIERTTTWSSAGDARPLPRNMPRGPRVPGQALGGISPTEIIRGLGRISNFKQAISDAIKTAFEMNRAGEMALPDEAVWSNAIAFLQAYAMVLDAPFIAPLQGGGLSAEWHEHGLDIELRFRRHRDVFTVIEDARSEIGPFMARDRDFEHATRALNLLAQRLI